MNARAIYFWMPSFFCASQSLSVRFVFRLTMYRPTCTAPGWLQPAFVGLTYLWLSRLASASPWVLALLQLPQLLQIVCQRYSSCGPRFSPAAFELTSGGVVAATLATCPLVSCSLFAIP